GFNDHFEAQNRFYGPQFGMQSELRLGNLFLNGTAKCAVGAMNQTVNIAGALAVVTPGGGLADTQGVYALPTNIGHHTRTVFGVIPELNGNVGYDLTQNIRAYVGYTFLWLDNVVRPGTNIDHAINPTQSFALS